MTNADDLGQILDAIAELQDDTTVPKNIKTKLQVISTMIKEEKADKRMVINKALDQLGELSEDVNIQAYTRTQLWNIVSMLESVS
ncbi:MAG: UPF0147 family protein [Candidatus Woesearchaeota archaeon]|nr:UPF0147 family protein [Candidatus Woesearchaeota archaeon]